MLAKPGMARHLLGARARVPMGLDTAIEAWEQSTGPLQAQPEVRAEDGRVAPLAEGAGSPCHQEREEPGALMG